MWWFSSKLMLYDLNVVVDLKFVAMGVRLTSLDHISYFDVYTIIVAFNNNIFYTNEDFTK